MLNIALFGPPGVGKGTQAQKLIEKYNLIYISTGNILREEINNNTELGLQAKAIIESGGLVDDEIIVKIIEKKFNSNTEAAGFLFDGFPRTFAQAYILEGLMLKMNTTLSYLISLEAPEEVLVDRLRKRSQLEDRKDDTDEVIEKRLQEYENKTRPVIQFYKDKNIYYPIHGEGEINEIFNQIVKKIESKLRKEWLNVIMLGYPGAGKGTQAIKLAEKYNLAFISAEALIKKEIEDQTETGKFLAPYIEKGETEPDEYIIRLIERQMKQHPKVRGFIFKGFPRNIVQAYIIEGLLKKVGSSVSCGLHIDISSLEAMKRLTQRGKSSSKKSYDVSTSTVIRRLENYEKKTLPIIESYKKQNKLYTQDGSGTKEEIFNAMCVFIEEAMKKIR